MLNDKDKYCPLPWTSIYHQLGTNSPCHCVRGLPTLSPMKYVKSNVLYNMKKSFINNEFPRECNKCETRESMGLKSTRKEALTLIEKYNIPEKYNTDSDTGVIRLELRFSNLCNFKCRMCEPYSSSELAKEMMEYDNFRFPEFGSNSVIHTDKKQIEELKKLSHNLKVLCLTGGEPFLIKEYYDFLDYLIENDLAKNITVELFTNCSVYNEKFISRLLKFKTVRFVVSIDGVGKTAEYIRHGTKWDVVKENIFKFSQLPFEFYYNTAISQYTLFDIENFAKFLIELYELNKNISTKCYAVISPSELHFLNMPSHLKKHTIEQINNAVEILKPDNFSILCKEILGIKNLLENTKSENENSFIEFTKRLDKIRNESFEDVFGLSLR